MPVQVLTFATGLDEAEGVARRIKEAVEAKQHCYRDCAVFLRINALSRALEAAFIKHRVPFQIVRGLAFFERKENKDVLAYLRLLLNPRDDLSFQRIVNEPPRGIGKVSIEHLRAYAEPRDIGLLAACEQVVHVPEIRGKAAAALTEFAALVRDLARNVEQPAEDLIRLVLDRTGYRKMLQGSTEQEDIERLANIEELITAARQFAGEDESRTVADFLESVSLASDQDSWNEKQDSVSVMTLHAAKGLEFPVVYMVAVEDGLLPHERSRFSNDELEEERRLAFVGMTRAKQELYICHAAERDFRGRTMYAMPSSFIGELPAEGVEHLDLTSQQFGRGSAHHEWRSGSASSAAGWEDAGVRPRIHREPPAKAGPATNTAAGSTPGWSVGMLVKHEKYGIGSITSVNGSGPSRKIKVRFPDHGEKTFVADKAKLAVVAAKRGERGV
jgi:DNA helicase-2/ATP-dependent DNA helicase PcrA